MVFQDAPPGAIHPIPAPARTRTSTSRRRHAHRNDPPLTLPRRCFNSRPRTTLGRFSSVGVSVARSSSAASRTANALTSSWRRVTSALLGAPLRSARHPRVTAAAALRTCQFDVTRPIVPTPPHCWKWLGSAISFPVRVKVGGAARLAEPASSAFVLASELHGRINTLQGL